MGIIEILSFAVSFSMDAFAVSICKGLATPKLKYKHMLITGLWFGGFQALMPTIGYFLGTTFRQYIESYDHWIAFILLALIGGNMIKESFSKEEEVQDACFGFKTMLVMAIATSIDALAGGVSFAMVLPSSQILFVVSSIGIMTFLFSSVGVKIGNVYGAKHKSKAELAGGVILIILGLKILLEHLGVINF